MILNKQEKFILSKMVATDKKINLAIVKDLFKTTYALSISDWVTNKSGQPQWVYQLRKSHQSLKDKGIITGSEFGTWQLTEKGIFYANQLSLVDLQNEEEINTLTIFEDDDEPNNSVLSVVYRKIRDTKISKELKKLYNHSCQICGKQIILGKQLYYSEGHHLKPLGNPHNGPDISANLIILCPNHHVEFDAAAIAINPNTNVIEHVDPSNIYIGESLKIILHNISIKYLIYHYQRFNSTKAI